MKRKNIIPYEPVGRRIEEAGAERVSQGAKIELAEHLMEYADQVGRLAVKLAQHAGRSTVTDVDVKLAAKQLE